MAPATLAPPEAATVGLMSVYEKHRVKLESPEEVISAQHGKYRVPGTGKEIVFNNYRASIPVEWMPLLEAHTERLLQRGIVAPEDQFMRVPEQRQGVQVGYGAMAAGTSAVSRAPREGWDEATTRQITEWLAGGGVLNVEAALTYELAHRRRKMIVRALTEHLLGDDAPAAAPPDPEPAALTAPVPEGIGGGEA